MKTHIKLIITGFVIQLTTMAFGRFAYTLILPAMMKSLEFSNTQMGMLGMGIVLGYLMNCLFSGVLSHRIGEERVVHISVGTLSVALFGLGFFSRFGVLLVFSVLLGAGAAGSYIPLVAILNTHFHERGKAYGIVTGGVGIGTMLCGYLVPLLLEVSQESGYRISWWVLSLINIMVLAPALLFLKNDHVKEKPHSAPQAFRGILLLFSKNRPLLLTGVIYFFLGFSYIIYVIYFGAYSIEEIGFSERSTGMMWSLFGINLIYSGIFWGALLDRYNKITVAVVVNALLAFSVLLVLPFKREVLFYISTFIFGFSFMGFLTVIFLFISNVVNKNEMAKVFGASTLIHSAGQIFSTFLAGLLKDITGTFKVSFGISLCILITCIFLFLVLRKKLQPATENST